VRVPWARLALGSAVVLLWSLSTALAGLAPAGEPPRGAGIRRQGGGLELDLLQQFSPPLRLDPAHLDPGDQRHLLDAEDQSHASFRCDLRHAHARSEALEDLFDIQRDVFRIQREADTRAHVVEDL